MEQLKQLVDFILHFDRHLAQMLTVFGPWTYVILFGIIFAETGLVVTPFLPGDSLLFAAGVMAGKFSDQLNIWVVMAVLTVAAILGDTVNYWIGKWIGPRAFTGRLWFLKKEHLDQTHAYFEKYGGKTIIIARFVPIVRTFAPFVAGIGAMDYRRFLTYNVIGGVCWVIPLTFVGYQLGSIEFVQKHFEKFVFAIIFLSILPMAWEFWQARRHRKAAAAAATASAHGSGNTGQPPT